MTTQERRNRARIACRCPGVWQGVAAAECDSRSGVGAEQHPQDRLGSTGVGCLAGDEVEVRVGLDQAHDDVGELVQVDGEREPSGVGLLVQQVFDRLDEAGLEARRRGG